MKLHHSIQTNKWHEIYKLINNQLQEFEDIYIAIDFIEFPLLLRLHNWLIFFNNNYFKASGFYVYTIHALVDASMFNEIFITQTKHEFDTSLIFYEQIINSNSSFTISDEETAKLLLNISLVYGKYPGMLVRSTIKGIKILHEGTSDYQLNKLFEFLFVRYEDPYFLSKNLNSLGLVEIEALMLTLQGNNIRNYKKLPFHLSKKESYLLINQIPKNIKFEDNLLERSIICAKLLLSASARKELLIPFLTFSKIFRSNVKMFHDDISFWKSSFNLMCTVNWEASTFSLQEFIDYFEYKKYTEDPKYNLNHRTINSISRSIYRWHEYTQYTKTKETLSLKWSGIVGQNLQITHKKILYVIKQITSAQNLYMESEKMKHCAYSYLNGCVNGHTSIWSIKKVINSIYKPYLTVEVRRNKIIQIAGIRNRRPNKEDYEVIKLWAHEVGFVIDTYY